MMNSLALRVPPWATGDELLTPGGERRAADPGTVTVERAFAAGDEVVLTLPMRPRG